jgi:hypothetical protein
VQLVYPILSISPNPATYGQSITITSTCNPTDTCAIDYPSLGTAIATGTGSATYTYTPFSLAAGTYSSFYANDITAALNSSPQVLTVDKSLTQLSLSNCTDSALPYQCTTTAKIYNPAGYNSLIGKLYKNNILVNQTSATSNTITNYISNAIGSFTYVFNTTGNENETSNSITVNFQKQIPITIRNVTATTQILTSKNATSYYPYELSAPSSNGIKYTITQNLTGSTLRIIGTANLTGNLYCDNLIIDANAILYTHGYSILCTGTVKGIGKIYTGASTLNVGAGGPTNGNGAYGYNATSSYGGSGGGGGNNGAGSNGGGHGGNTVAPGGANGNPGANGATPSPPTLSVSLLQSWISNGIQNYLEGATGGGGAGDGNGGGSAGAKSENGLLVQGSVVNLTGIIANGSVSGPNDGYASGCGGDGGGGSITVVYKTSYSITANILGGQGSRCAGGSSGGKGGNGGNGQIMSYQTSTFPYYKTFNSILSTIENNVSNFNYTLSSNTIAPAYPINNITGLYSSAGEFNAHYNVSQMENSTKLYVNINVLTNMTDIKSFTVTSPSTCIQYLPCEATVNFNEKPQSWYIVSNPASQSNYTNTTATTAQFQSESLSYAPLLHLTYSFAQFTTNALNNALQPINFSQFKFTLANTISPNLRNVANISIFSQYTFNAIANVNATLKLTGSLNGFAINGIVSNTTNNNTGIYHLEIPKSSYVNPKLILVINASYQKISPPYFTQTDLYCPLNASEGSSGSYPVGLVDTNGTKYTFYVTSAGGSTLAGDLMQVIEQSGVHTTNVQSVQLPNTTPFTLPLESAGQSYAFDIANQQCTSYYYKGGLSQPPNPIYLFVNQITGAYIINASQAFGACKITNLNQTGDKNYSILCVGGDPTNLVYSWNVQIYNTTSIVGTHELVYNRSVGGSTLDFNLTLPRVNSTYVYQIIAYANKNNDPIIGVNGGPLDFIPIKPSSPIYGFLILLLGLVVLSIGAVTGKVVILFSLLLMLIGGVAYITPVQVPFYVLIAMLTISGVIIWWVRKK